MASTPNLLLHGWRYGLHPRAVGMRVGGLVRVELPLGESLRVELVTDAPGSSETGDLQYYIVTEAGPWALWLSCPRANVAAAEAALRELVYPLPDGREGA